MKPFIKDDPRINRAGRKKGSPNKSTNDLREMVQTFINENWYTIQDDFLKLDPSQRLSFIEKMLKHVLPAPINPLDLNRLSESDLDQVIQKLRQMQTEHKN